MGWFGKKKDDDMPPVPHPDAAEVKAAPKEETPTTPVEKKSKKSLAEKFLEKKRKSQIQRELLKHEKEAEKRIAASEKQSKSEVRKKESEEKKAPHHFFQGLLAMLHNPLGKKSHLKEISDEEELEEELVVEDQEKAGKKRAEETDKRARKLLKQKSKQTKRKRRTSLHRRRIMSQLLLKAGYEQKPEKLQRVVFYLSFILIGLATLVTLVMGAVSGKQVTDLVIFYTGLWTAIFAFTYLFIWMVIYLYLDVRIYQRTRELEEVLPDFLQLTSANISAGMPIDRALWFAIRPNFGVLAKEIEQVAKATLAGEELSESLLKFTERYDSLMLKRSISILLEGLAAGGELAELLNKIALNIQETKILRKEMSANVATYAIFITFASIIMAPFLFALASQLLTIIVAISSTLNLENVSNSFLTLNIKTTPAMIGNFRNFALMMLAISSIMSASIVSVIRHGRVKESLRNLPIFLAVSITLYFFAAWMLGLLFGGFF